MIKLGRNTCLSESSLGAFVTLLFSQKSVYMFMSINDETIIHPQNP